MRDYGKVSPQFWVGQTGRGLRGNMHAQIVALYLMTSPHANMIGVFYCPIEYIAKETGLTIEGASKGLQSLIEADFCTYEEASEYVFVHEFAHNQVGDSLKANDKRVQGVQNELAKVPKGQCWQSFRARYAVPYNLPTEGVQHKPLASPLQAPSKPETGAGAETGAEDISSPSGDSSLPACPQSSLIDLYRKHLPNLPQPRKELWTGAKADGMKARWRWVLTAKRESGDRYAQTADQALTWFDKFFEHAAQSDFLTGRNGKWRGCDLAWLMKAENFAKVVQGNYVNEGAAA